MTAQPTRQLKLGAILEGAGADHATWRDPNVPGDASVNIDWYIENARAAEAAKSGLVFIVDSPYITPDTAPHFLNRLEPLTLLSALAVSTSKIELVGTLTTSCWEPYNVARQFGSLDHISKGRAGWNVVTTGLEGHDFSKYELDAPFPDLTGVTLNSYKGHAERIIRVSAQERLTVRQAAYRFGVFKSDFVGAPETIANEIERWFLGGAADGFNLRVIPILQQNGVFRTDYTHDTLRGHLGLPVPENRYIEARNGQAIAAG